MRSKVLFGIILLAVLVVSSAVFAQDPDPTLPPEGEVIPADVEPEGPTLESVTADTAAYLGQEVTLEGFVEEFVNVRTFVLHEGAALDDDKVLVINNSPDEYPMHLVVGQRVLVTGIVTSSYEEGGLEQVLNNFMGSMTVPQTTDTGEETAEPTEAEPAEDADATPMTETGEDVETTPEVEEAEGAEDAAQATSTTEADQEGAETTPEAEATPEIEPTAEVPESPDVEAEPITHDFGPLTNVIVERFGNFTILEVTSVMAITVVPEEIEEIEG